MAQLEQMDFVYAYHADEYAEDIGTALLSKNASPDVIALEWADIGDTKEEIEQQLRLARVIFRNITTPGTSPEVVDGSLKSAGPFYGPLLKPLAGSDARIALIDVYNDLDLSRRSKLFHEYEQDMRLSRVVSNPQLSLDARKDEILSIASKAAEIIVKRDEVVVMQLEGLASEADTIAVYQGSMHQRVADAVQGHVNTLNVTYIPVLNSWTGEAIKKEDHMPLFQKLVLSVIENGPDGSLTSEQLVERTLLGEYVVAHIFRSQQLRVQAGNAMGAMIAAARIVEGLDAERIRSRLRAVVKHQRAGSPTSKVIGPLMPKHSLRVLP